MLKGNMGVNVGTTRDEDANERRARGWLDALGSERRVKETLQGLGVVSLLVGKNIANVQGLGLFQHTRDTTSIGLVLAKRHGSHITRCADCLDGLGLPCLFLDWLLLLSRLASDLYGAISGREHRIYRNRLGDLTTNHSIRETQT